LYARLEYLFPTCFSNSRKERLRPIALGGTVLIKTSEWPRSWRRIGI
jgi:hypothetical protein